MPPQAKKLCFLVAATAAILIQYANGTHLNPTRYKRQSPCRRNQFQCNSGSCLEVYLLCDGKIHCSDESDESAAICHRKVCPSQAFKCDYGACVDRAVLCNGVEDCADGSDEKSCAARPPGSISEGPFIFGAPEESSSQVRCPALDVPWRDITCKLNNRHVNCSKPVLPGTIGSVQCSPFYSHTDKEEDYYEIVCQFDGTWSRNITRCQPTCGVPNPDGIPFIAGGTKSKYGEYPWHVGIYRPNGGTYEQICGGNIISERDIVTAGHCFWNDATSSFITDVRGYKVAVGKYYREWNSPQDRYAQTFDIEKVVPHRRFRGNLRNWHNDIAVITLKNDIRMTLAARPICVDFKGEQERLLAPGLKGTVVGWGVTETMKPGEVLHTTTLPYISFEDCEKKVPKPFLVYLSNDKFCAGYQNGTSVCPGDGGGGFATRFNDGKWYLTGIVSVGVPARNGAACNVNQYATFTTVSDYYNFIEENKYKTSDVESGQSNA